MRNPAEYVEECVAVRARIGAVTKIGEIVAPAAVSTASGVAVREEQRIFELVPEATPIAVSFGPSSSFKMDALHGGLADAEHLAA